MPMFHIRNCWLLVSLFLLIKVPFAFAQFPFEPPTENLPPSSLVEAEAYLSAEPVQVGSRVQVAVVAKIAPEWHINSHQPTLDTLIPTEVTVTPPDGFRVGPIFYPEGKRIRLSFAGDTELSVYEREVTFGFVLEVDRDQPPGNYTLPITLSYQGCSDTQCLLPASLELEVPIEVVSLDRPVRRAHPEIFAGLDLTATPSPASGTDSQIGRWIEERGYVLTFALLFVLGLGLNLTPCVFPMIPITVSYFGGQAGGNARRTFVLALFYVLGISITISILGVLAALSGGIWGSALQNPIVLLVVAGVLIALALSMFGLYEFRLPSFLMNQSGGARAGILGSLFMGLTMGIVAAPCIGPVVLGLLFFVSQTANPVLGFWMFFVLAWGLGLPYVFLALFSGAIQRLPRSGVWMVTVKKIFGFVLIGMAIYFLEGLMPASIAHEVLPVYLVLAGLYIGWMDRKQVNWGFALVKWGIAIAGIAAGVWFLLPSQASAWPLYDEAAFEEARQAGQPIILDFFADWCFSCKELEERTFSDPRVQEKLKRFALFRVDLTQSNDFTKRMEQRYGIRGLPTVIFLDSSGKEHPDLRVEQFIGPEAFIARIEQVP